MVMGANPNAGEFDTLPQDRATGPLARTAQRNIHEVTTRDESASVTPTNCLSPDVFRPRGAFKDGASPAC